MMTTIRTKGVKLKANMVLTYLGGLTARAFVRLVWLHLLEAGSRLPRHVGTAHLERAGLPVRAASSVPTVHPLSPWVFPKARGVAVVTAAAALVTAGLVVAVVLAVAAAVVDLIFLGLRTR